MDLWGVTEPSLENTSNRDPNHPLTCGMWRMSIWGRKERKGRGKTNLDIGEFYCQKFTFYIDNLHAWRWNFNEIWVWIIRTFLIITSFNTCKGIVVIEKFGWILNMSQKYLGIYFSGLTLFLVLKVFKARLKTHSRSTFAYV